MAFVLSALPLMHLASMASCGKDLCSWTAAGGTNIYLHLTLTWCCLQCQNSNCADRREEDLVSDTHAAEATSELGVCLLLCLRCSGSLWFVSECEKEGTVIRVYGHCSSKIQNTCCFYCLYIVVVQATKVKSY